MTPRVKQCITEGLDFGAVAVELPTGEWAVMTLNRGGDFRSAERVESWPLLDPPGDLS
jgi:hypothetical protein